MQNCKDSPWKRAQGTSLQLLAPFAPHIAEELWHGLGHEDSVQVDHWPQWDSTFLASDTMTIVVQVNGKVRGQVEVPTDASKEQIIEAAT